MRILIVKLGSIGDIVHTLPSLAAIREALPDAEISWVVERRTSEILRDNPLLDRLIEIDTKALRRGLMSGETLRAPRQQLRLLRASGAFDLALDFQGLIKSAMIARLSGAERIYGFAREALREPPSRFLLHETVSIPAGVHVIRKNLHLVESALGIPVPVDENELKFPIALDESHEREAESAAGMTGDYAILNPGGGWPTKLWSAEKFGALADELWNHFGFHSLVTVGPGEDELAQRVLAHSKSGKAKSVTVSLKGFCALAKHAEVYVGGETGPTHLAIAMRTPVVGLLGPTEWWRNGSPYADDICVERNDIGCRENCHRRSCSQWICMDIEVERVLHAVTDRLQRVKKIAGDRLERALVPG